MAAAAGDGETDGDGEALLSEDSAESGPSDQEYSVVDSEEVEGEEREAEERAHDMALDRAFKQHAGAATESTSSDSARARSFEEHGGMDANSETGSTVHKKKNSPGAEVAALEAEVDAMKKKEVS